MTIMKNMHIPLPVQWYEKLKDLAEVSHTSATELVRAAVIEFIKKQEKKTIDNAIAQFASEYGGTEWDLDKDLEDTSLECLRRT